jgi:hypothetical protein
MGFLKSIFKALDPILDKIDPMHNKVQTWTTGHSDTEGQAPYFQKIAPQILNAFFPGVGSAVAAADAASEGNTKGAIINAVGAYGSWAADGKTILGVDSKTLGTVVSIGATAYSLYDASGSLKATYQDPNSMPQQSMPVYYGNSFGTAYGGLTSAPAPSNPVLDSQIMAAKETEAQNRAVLVVSALALLFYFARKG